MVKYLESRQNAFIQEAEAGNPEALPLALETAFKLDSFLNRSRDQLALTASLNRLIEQERRHYAAAIDVALRLYRETGEGRYHEDAYYFASSQKSNLLNRYLNSPDLAETMGLPAEVVEQQQDLELRVLILEQSLNTAEEDEQARIREELLSVNRELDVQREAIANDYPAFSQALRGYKRLDVAAAQAALEDNQLVVEYFLSDSSVYVFTIGREGLDHYVLPRPEGLDALVAAANTDAAVAAQLYQALLAPALPQNDNITRLQFIPDGALWQLSFAALRNNDRYLIEDYAISYAYASAMLFADRSGLDVGEGYLGNGISYDDIIRRINASPKRSVVGNQLRNLGPLPFARREVDEAAVIMGGTPRINAEATKARFLEEGPTAGILHLAMHGIVNDNPMENALVFRGERDTFDLLTMQEVLARKFPAALTILSACHSGNGPLQQNEGVQSIGRAFMAAGSRSTITSAWEAQDEATY
ncbi:MAG: CHAT domain-containing protein, partial [Bacteroidota bacterium]